MHAGKGRRKTVPKRVGSDGEHGDKQDWGGEDLH